jgi:hypothetical protein
MPPKTLEVDEVIHALQQLGGEATWEDIWQSVTENRGSGFAPYLDWFNYRTTMFQLVQQHCKVYKKFKGPVYFEQVGHNPLRFKLSPEYGSIIQKPVTEINTEDQEQTIRTLREQYIRLRKPELVHKIKLLYNYHCQICGRTIELGNGRLYAEIHHVKPLGSPHGGPDNLRNMLCVCPNHHVQLDYGAIRLDKLNLHIDSEHRISDEYIEYHNNVIFGQDQNSTNLVK